MEISTVCLRRAEEGWNSTRNVRNYSFLPFGEIRPGLAKRLAAYAARELARAGFGGVLAGCLCEVLTTDGDMSTSDRDYQVTFYMPSGGSLSVDGILTGRGGWPIIDHGFTASR